jgi:hypothetical protein
MNNENCKVTSANCQMSNLHSSTQSLRGGKTIYTAISAVRNICSNYVIFLFKKICHKLGILSTLLSLHFDELFLGRAGGMRFGMIV